MEALLFWTFTAISILGGVGVVIGRNPVNGAMALVGSFFGLAGLFLLLNAQLIAALQVLVYTGAIMVLFLFVIMLLSLTHLGDAPPRLTVHQVVGGAAAMSLLACLIVAIWHWHETLAGGRGREALTRFGTLEQVGGLLYTRWLLPFEAVSLLLLVAMVGAVVVAKPRI